MSSLAILLPLTSKSPFIGTAGSSRLLEGLQCLRDSLSDDGAAKTAVVIGIDEDDAPLLALLPEIGRCLGGDVGLEGGGRVRVETFARAELDEHPPGPICWMWDRLAKAAMEGSGNGMGRPDLLLLLGAVLGLELMKRPPARSPYLLS